jgi:hypothetical protein
MSPQSFNLPLRTSQSPSRFLLFPSQTSDCENLKGSQPSNSLSQSIGPLTFHDPFLKWIEHSPESMTWHDFVPPSHLHELDFIISDDIVHSLTHVIFALNLLLFWFMMKHRSRIISLPLSFCSQLPLSFCSFFQLHRFVEDYKE